MAQDKGNPGRPPIPSRALKTNTTPLGSNQNPSVDTSSTSFISAKQMFDPQAKPTPVKAKRSVTAPATTIPKPESTKSEKIDSSQAPTKTSYSAFRSNSLNNIPKNRDEVRSTNAQPLIKDLTQQYQEANKEFDKKKHELDETIEHSQIITQQLANENKTKGRLLMALNNVHEQILEEKEKVKTLKKEVEEKSDLTNLRDANHLCGLLEQGILVTELEKNPYLDNFNVLNKYGQTVLHVATRKGETAALKILLKKGANPNKPNSKDFGERLPLHLVFLDGASSLDISKINEEVFALLLPYTNASIKDKYGKTALDYLKPLDPNASHDEKNKHQRILNAFDKNTVEMEEVYQKAKKNVEHHCNLMTQGQQAQLNDTSHFKEFRYDDRLKQLLIMQNKDTVAKTLRDLDPRLQPAHRENFQKILENCQRHLAKALDEDPRFPKKEAVRFYDKKSSEIDSGTSTPKKSKPAKKSTPADNFFAMFTKKSSPETSGKTKKHNLSSPETTGKTPDIFDSGPT